MDRFAMGFLLYSGLWTLGMDQEEYRLMKEKKNWTDAQQYCRKHHTDLATVHSEDDLDILDKAYADSGRVWIGYHGEWQWSLSDLHGEGEANYSNWATDEPNNPGGDKERCTLLGEKGKWYTGGCKRTLPFICYNETGQKHIAVPLEKVWHEAQRYCRANHTDLASVRTRTENDQVYDTAREYLKGVNGIWIGLIRGQWRWSDQANSSFTNWEAIEPNNAGREEYCAMVRFDKKGEWEDTVCSDKYNFLCYDDDLVLVTQNYTWAEALEYCRARHGDLVTVSSPKLQRWVSRRARKATTRHVWLGLCYTCTLDFWFWVSQESLCFSHWAPGFGAGTEECGLAGALDTAGGYQWVSRPDTDRLNFICEKYSDEE